MLTWTKIAVLMIGGYWMINIAVYDSYGPFEVGVISILYLIMIKIYDKE